MCCSVYCDDKTIEMLTRLVSGTYRCLLIYPKVCESSVCSSVVLCATVREGPPYIPENGRTSLYTRSTWKNSPIYPSKLEVRGKIAYITDVRENPAKSAVRGRTTHSPECNADSKRKLLHFTTLEHVSTYLMLAEFKSENFV